MISFPFPSLVPHFPLSSTLQQSKKLTRTEPVFAILTQVTFRHLCGSRRNMQTPTPREERTVKLAENKEKNARPQFPSNQHKKGIRNKKQQSQATKKVEERKGNT